MLQVYQRKPKLNLWSDDRGVGLLAERRGKQIDPARRTSIPAGAAHQQASILPQSDEGQLHNVLRG